MKTWLRRGLWVLALLIGLPLLLVLSWWLLNLADVEPQPWPQALELPRNNVPVADNLATLLGTAPAIQGDFTLGHCDGKCVHSFPPFRAQLIQSGNNLLGRDITSTTK